MSYKPEHLNGPAPTHTKLLRKHLLRMGVEEHRLPRELKDKVVKRSKKGPIGAIVVRDMTGLESNVANRLVRKFEQNITGGKADIAEKLEAVSEDLRPEELALLDLLRKPHKKSLAHLMAEARVEPTRIMRAYARGAVELGKVEAAIAAHNGLPAVIRDLVRHAVDGLGVCDVCVGTGVVKQRKGDKGPEGPCPGCDGSGTSMVSSPLKEFAVQKILEVTKQVGREPLVQMNTQNNTLNVSGGGFLEKMLQVSDAILYPDKSQEPSGATKEPSDIVEAVQVTADAPESLPGAVKAALEGS